MRSPSTASSVRAGWRLLLVLGVAARGLAAGPEGPPAAARHIYYTGGVHNDEGCAPPEKCVPARQPGEPSDPLYPQWWVSTWTMYRVFGGYREFPPPYASPPAGLTPDDYQVSFGFSPENHPPRRDFIKHLPYDAARSAHVGGSIQAYAREVGPQKILFGCAFYRDATSDDPADPDSPRYRHPQSFFFSGYPLDPPNAPIVSQNYTSFRADRPDPVDTWGQVSRMCPAEPDWCCLFEGDCPTAAASEPPAAGASSWGDMGPEGRAAPDGP